MSADFLKSDPGRPPAARPSPGPAPPGTPGGASGLTWGAGVKSSSAYPQRPGGAEKEGGAGSHQTYFQLWDALTQPLMPQFLYLQTSMGRPFLHWTMTHTHTHTHKVSRGPCGPQFFSHPPVSAFPVETVRPSLSSAPILPSLAASVSPLLVSCHLGPSPVPFRVPMT